MSSENILQILTKVAQIKPDNNSVLEIENRFIIDARKPTGDIGNNVITTYNKEQTIEIAKSLIAKYTKYTKSVSQTINFIRDSKIKTLVFINGVQQKSLVTCYAKTRIINPIILLHDYLPASKFTANFETPIADWNATTAASARIRLRFSILIDLWQLDITLVKSITDFANPSNLVNAKALMFGVISVENFVEKAPWNDADAIEFELEFKADTTKFDIKALTLCNDLFTDVIKVKKVDNVYNSSINYQDAIYQIAKLIRPSDSYKFKHSEGLKSLSNQVIELNKNMYLRDVAANITNYYITDKIDGKRTILYVVKDKLYAINDKIEEISLKANSDGISIFDTEFYNGVYYVFDVLMFEDKLLINEDFSDRLTYFDKTILVSDKIKTKQFIKLTSDFKKQISEFKKQKKNYEIDGIILTPADGKYLTMLVYKYKPIDKLSVDFLIKKCPDNLLSIEPYAKKPNATLYLLFCGIRSDVFKKLRMKLPRGYSDIFPHIDAKNPPKYFPICFSASDMLFSYLYYAEESEMKHVANIETVLAKLDNSSSSFSTNLDNSSSSFSTNLDNTIGEFVYNCQNKQWQLHKIRDDRQVEVVRGNYFGNNYKIAEMIWSSYKAPLIIEDEKTHDVYFQEHDNQLQKASRNFNSFVKAHVLESIQEKKIVVDLASGKGQDLFRYGKSHINELICLEIDAVALEELINRKFIFSTQHSNDSMAIFTQQMDLNENYSDNAKKLYTNINLMPNYTDLIVCNFAFHYLIKDLRALKNILSFVSLLLKTDGKFMFSTFDGAAIIKLLNENNGNYTIYDGDNALRTSDNKDTNIKYSIKKTSPVNTLEPIGQQIDVLLPFSSNVYYREYLVNAEYIEQVAATLSLKLIEKKSFIDYLKYYSKASELNDDDKLYSSLYYNYTFVKVDTKSKSKKSV